MTKITLAAALVAASLAPLPMMAASAHAEATAPMEAAGTAGEHVDPKAMKKGPGMKKPSMKKRGSKAK